MHVQAEITANRAPTQNLTVLLLSYLNTAISGAVDEAEGAVVDVGKVGFSKASCIKAMSESLGFR